LLLALGVMLVVLVAGCRMPWVSNSTPIAARQPETRQTTNLPVVVSNATLAKEAVRTVTDYVQALEEDHYTTAYALLSQESQQLHPFSDFERLGKQGMPSFDLKTAQATVTDHQAVVSVSFVEDANTAGFHLTRENGRWKVLYRGGSPGMPDPREPSGGTQREKKRESHS
jgi:hypothetical protein